MVGYKSQEFQYAGQSKLEVMLETDAGNLEEVIVVGFGTQQKSNLTGAVDQISGRQLESRPVSNIMQGLQGVSPGLNITYGSGSPGEIPNINIRGTTSIRSEEHTSELQSLMRISYAVFCLKKKNNNQST